MLPVVENNPGQISPPIPPHPHQPSPALCTALREGLAHTGLSSTNGSFVYPSSNTLSLNTPQSLIQGDYNTNGLKHLIPPVTFSESKTQITMNGEAISNNCDMDMEMGGNGDASNLQSSVNMGLNISNNNFDTFTSFLS